MKVNINDVFMLCFNQIVSTLMTLLRNKLFSGFVCDWSLLEFTCYKESAEMPFFLNKNQGQNLAFCCSCQLDSIKTIQVASKNS